MQHVFTFSPFYILFSLLGYGIFLRPLHGFLPLPGKLRSNLPLLRPTLSMSICHCCFSSALTAFSTCNHTAMPLVSTHFTPFCSISTVLHTLASTQTNFYTNQLLHKRSLAPSTFCRSPLLHQPALQKPTFTQTRFPKTTFYANQLLDKRAFTLTSFYTNQLFDQPAFTETAFCSNQLFQTSFYTNQLLHKPAFKFTQTNF